MWSHYAEEHKGCVIEIEVDDSSPLKLFNQTEPTFQSYSSFNKVNYRKTRCYQGEFGNNTLGGSELWNYYLLGKSDEWIYEKEHRYAVHHVATVTMTTGFILIDKLHLSNWKEIVSGFGKFISQNDEAGRFFQIDLPDNNIEVNKLISTLNQFNSTEVMCFIDLIPSKATKVFMGVNSDTVAYENARNSSEYISDIKMHHATLSPDRFELEFEPYEHP